MTDDPTFPLISEEEALANANRDFGKQWDSYSTMGKRTLFQDIRFREALSICVDRNLLNETLTNGMSDPWQTSAPGADESWSKKWTEYDVDGANALMDELTEPWDRTPETYRKMKGTNKDIEIIVSVREPSESGDFLSLLQAAYKKIGVRLSTKVDTDFRTTMLSNDVEACVEIISASTPAIRPDSIVPIRSVMVWFSAYGKWYEDGKTEANGGIEPTGDMRKLIDAYDRMTAACGPDRQQVVDECVKEIYDLHELNVWLIGYLKPLPERFIVNKNLKNFKEGLMYVDEFRFEGLAHPEQFWMAE